MLGAVLYGQDFGSHRQVSERAGVETNEQNAPAELLEWDTSFFGARIGRVRAHRLDDGDVENLDAWAKTHRVECLYLLADSSHQDTVRRAEQAGFSLVDVRVTLRRREPSESVLESQEFRLRDARSQDLPALGAIAGTSHTDSRFYADRGFSTKHCRRLYERWIERDCELAWANDDAFVLVAELGGTTVGYLTGRVREGDDGPAKNLVRGTIGLVGVDASARGHGIGTGLVRAGLDRFGQHGCSDVFVVTQGRNVAAQRLYQLHGFRTRQVQFWYHRWSF